MNDDERIKRMRESAKDLRLATQYADDRRAAKEDLNMAARLDSQADLLESRVPPSQRPITPPSQKPITPPAPMVRGRGESMKKAMQNMQAFFKASPVKRCANCWHIRTNLNEDRLCERCGRGSVP